MRGQPPGNTGRRKKGAEQTGRMQSGREGREPGLQGLHAECEPALTQRTGLEVVSAL